MPRRPLYRSIYFWLNVLFVIVLIGLVVGSSSQSWYFIVAVAWIVLGVIVTRRARRSVPRPPNLFEDDFDRDFEKNFDRDFDKDDPDHSGR